MRVIGGSARGRTLKSPPKPRDAGKPGIRPTSDMIRGVIFDMLDSMGADYARVLDLYAGTGALGIEALSRGEGTADFVDNDGAATANVQANLEATGFGARGTVYRMPSAGAVSRLKGPYTLVLADPPYYDEDVFAAIASVAASQLVDDATIVVVEHHKREQPPEALGRLPVYRRRQHGDSVVSIYALEEVP